MPEPAAAAAVTPEQLRAEYDRGVNDGKAIGNTEEKTRIATILNSPEAAAKPKLAKSLAITTPLTADQALTVLKDAQPETTAAANPLATAMAGVDNPTVGVNQEQTASDSPEALAAQVLQFLPKRQAAGGGR